MANSLLSFVEKDPTKGIGSVLRRSSLIYMMVTAILISGFVLPQVVSAKDNAANQHWVGTWSTSPVTEGQPFEDQTLRQIVHISIGGEWVRVRLSNRFGTVPLVIDAASIGVQNTGATVVPGSLRELTFGGEASVSIAAGAKVLSDPVELTVADEADLAVSLYVSDNTEGSTMHSLAWQTSYISEGNRTAHEVIPVDETETTTSWFWLTGVEVLAHRNTHAVVTFGDSITEGCCDSDDTNTNTRYPDELARLLLARYPGKVRVAVLNAGISGNRVLNDSTGPNAQVRLDPDVLTQSGVTHVILLEGINDIGFADFGVPSWDVSADDIIAGYKQTIERVQAMGLKIFIGTLTPWQDNPFYYYEAGDDKRDAVNIWIRANNLSDGVIDFDEVIRDPNDPEMMLPLYDEGDHLHPSAAGYAAMAEEAEKVLLAPGKGHIQRP
jgi:lysophospholipase L1-like esterase